MSNVSVIKCESYDQSQVDQAIQQSLALLGGLAQFIKPGQKVLIKPNMLTGSPPEKAAATHPAVVASVIRQVKKLGAIAIVGDSPGFESTKKAAKGSGILGAIEQEGAILAEFNRTVEVEFKDGFVCRNVPLARKVLEADVIINVAKLKTHGYSGITAAVKNLFGCIPGVTKAQYHLKYPNKTDFKVMLLDLLRVVKPAINIVDAVLIQEGAGGPSNGTPRWTNLIISGTDAVAVDSICAVLTGKNPHDFDFLKQAEIHHIGETNLEKIEVLGESLKENVIKDFKHINLLGDVMLPRWIPDFILPHVRRILLDRPVLAKGKCTKCEVCYKVCAPKAITIKESRPTFDYATCIGCYCCQEMCQFSAISIKKSMLARILIKISSIIS